MDDAFIRQSRRPTEEENRIIQNSEINMATRQKALRIAKRAKRENDMREIERLAQQEPEKLKEMLKLDVNNVRVPFIYDIEHLEELMRAYPAGFEGYGMVQIIKGQQQQEALPKAKRPRKISKRPHHITHLYSEYVKKLLIYQGKDQDINAPIAFTLIFEPDNFQDVDDFLYLINLTRDHQRTVHMKYVVPDEYQDQSLYLYISRGTQRQSKVVSIDVDHAIVILVNPSTCTVNVDKSPIENNKVNYIRILGGELQYQSLLEFYQTIADKIIKSFEFCNVQQSTTPPSPTATTATVPSQQRVPPPPITGQYTIPEQPTPLRVPQMRHIVMPTRTQLSSHVSPRIPIKRSRNEVIILDDSDEEPQPQREVIYLSD